MANKHKGIIPIELDKERNLRYDMNALAEIEDGLGIELSELADVKMTMKSVRLILWAGLIHEDEQLTQRDVGSMVDMANMSYVQEKIAEAFAVSGKNE